MSITLHHVAFSRSFRVLWLLSEMGLECTLRPYSLTDGALRSADFLAISPGGRVPALEIDGQTLFESGAILEYLCETRPEFGLGRRAGDPERARYLEWMHYAETQAHILANLNLQHVFLQPPELRSATMIKLDTKRLQAALRVLEQALADQDYLLAGGFSAADVMQGFNLFAAAYFVDMAIYPNLQAYRARIEARPAYQKARAAEGEQQFYAQDFYEVPTE